MKEMVEKIRERLKEARKECVKLQKTTDDAYGYMKQKHGIDTALTIISEVEAEYGNPKTNADRIRSMSDEELAEYIHGVSEATKPCVRCGEDCDFCELPAEECKKRVLKWLQEGANHE